MRTSFKLALSYLKKQKGRSLALITSIALAVILVFALNVIPETISKEQIKEAYNNFSDYHVEYTDLNKNTISKLNDDKDVKKIDSTLNLGNIVNKSGASISLNSYNKNFIDSFGYKFIKGHEPKNENEIVLEEKALQEMGISNKLNQTIDFNIVKRYVDENDKNQIYSKNIKLKLVGIIQKPAGYYENNEYYKVKGFVNAKENNNILPQELVGYNGVLKFKTKKPSMSMANKKIGQYGLNDYNFMVNVSLTEVLNDYQMTKSTNFSRNNKLIPMVAAALVIYNIFNIILIEMTKQIGMLRAIGLSKKKVKYMLIIQGLIVLVLGLIVGYTVGALFSVMGLSTIYGHFVKLYISKASILEPMMMASVAVLLSMIFIIYKCNKISPMEAIRFTNKSNRPNKNRFYHKLIKKAFGITGEMAFKNVFRNKSRTLLSVLSISLAGMLFISKMAVYNDGDDFHSTSMLITTMGDSDIILRKDSRNTDENFSYYSDDQVNKISRIKEITSMEKSINSPAYINTNIDDINDNYKTMAQIKNDKKDIELDIAVKGYDDEGLKSFHKFIEKGSNIIEKDSDVTENSNKDYASVLISNNYYSPYTATNDQQVLKNVKVNDLIDIKIPVKENNKLIYKNQKVRVVGILNKDYVVNHSGGLTGGVQLIFNEKDYKNLTNSSGYNNISLSIKKDSDEKVIKKIEDITKSSSFVDMESKYNNMQYFEKQSEENKKLVLISVLLTLLISSINIICIIRTNIMIRINEISTLRALGMNLRKVKNMIIKESLIYGTLSIIVASIISSLDYYKFVQMVNWGQQQGFGKENVMAFNIPFMEIMQFSIATIAICLLAVYLSKNKIEKLSIVEGLRDNE